MVGACGEFTYDTTYGNLIEDKNYEEVTGSLFTGVPRMDIILVEVKGADLDLLNNGHYAKFSGKIETAVTQIRDRLRFIYSDITGFRSHVHNVREKVESGLKI